MEVQDEGLWEGEGVGPRNVLKYLYKENQYLMFFQGQFRSSSQEPLVKYEKLKQAILSRTTDMT